MTYPLELSGTSLLLTAILAVAAVACVQVDSDPGDEGGEGGCGAEGCEGEEPKPDLFACALPVDCTMDAGHLGETVTPEMMKCQSDLTLSGDHGVQRYVSVPGPYPTEVESLIVLRGDGTAIRQARSRCMVDGGCEQQNTTAWRLSELEDCDVVPFDVEDPEQCGEGEEECVYPMLENCAVRGLDFACAEAAP
jgi:hypothetical protein